MLCMCDFLQMVSLQVEGTSLLLQLGIGQLELKAANLAEAETWAEALRMPLAVHEDVVRVV